MSATQSNDEQSQNNYNREPAVRATVQEINQAKDEFKTSEAERAPSYQLLPTGAGANRVLTAGTLIDVEDVSNADSDGSYMKATISAESGTVYAYAGRYSEDARAFLEEAETPQFVAVCGKMDLYPDDEPVEDRRVSLSPEWIQTINADRRDEILLDNAVATIERADGAGVDALVDRADDQYKFDEDFEDTDFRAGAVEVLESLDAFHADEEAEGEEMDDEVEDMVEEMEDADEAAA